MLYSLRNRLTVLFIALAILPTGLVSFILTQNGFDALRDEAQKSQQQVAVRSRVEIEAFIQVRETQLRDLQEINNLTSLGEDEQVDLLNNLLSNDRAYQDLILLRGNGQEVVHLSRQEVVARTEDVDHTTTPEYQAMVAGESIYYSSVYLDDRSGEPLIAMAIPYTDLRSGSLSYILIAELRFRSIWDLVNDIGQSLSNEEVSVYIVDSTNKVVAHANPSVVLSNTEFVVPDTTNQVEGLNSDEVFLAADTLTLGNQALRVVAERPASVALEVASEGQRIALIVTALALVVAAVTGFVTVRQIVQPITRLSNTAQEISQGNLQARAIVQGKSEISVLARAFNQMTDQLSDLINTLEDRVKRRTVDLEKAREEAEAANRVKSQFLANMSHELRTPLNAVLNFTAFVGDGVFGPVNEEQKEALDESLDSGRHLLSLINDVLDLTKIESGMMDLFIEEVDFNKLLTSSLSVAKGLIKDKPLQFNSNIEEDLPRSYGDRRRLRQVFLNVVSNAVKYTPSGQVNLAAKFKDNQIHITVQDTGIGIAEEDHEMVFESFKQSKHELTRTLGTGLGLPISKFFVESHQGKIWFESKINSGTTFHIVLPILTEEEAYQANTKEIKPVAPITTLN